MVLREHFLNSVLKTYVLNHWALSTEGCSALCWLVLKGGCT